MTIIAIQKKKIGRFLCIRSMIASIVLKIKNIKNKFVPTLTTPTGNNSSNITLQIPITPNNHSISVPLVNVIYEIKFSTISMTCKHFSYATNPKAAVNAANANPFIIHFSSLHSFTIYYKVSIFSYHRTLLHVSYKVVRFLIFTLIQTFSFLNVIYLR